MGSILAITDALGTIVEERQFGAWGTVDQFRASDGSTEFSHNSLLGRGYTGHEHFFEVGLIHMNGRMCDAQLGRFLSPDNYVQGRALKNSPVGCFSEGARWRAGDNPKL